MARGRKSTKRGAKTSASKEDTSQDTSMEETVEETSTQEEVKPEEDVEGDEVKPEEVKEVDNKAKDVLTTLKEKGYNENSATQLEKLIANGHMSLDDFSEDVSTELNALPESKASGALSEFAESDFGNVSNKMEHLISLIKSWKENPEKSHEENVSSPSKSVDAAPPPLAGPDKDKLQALLDRTGFKHEVTSGQRHYGPPANFEGEGPGHVHEVFIGKLPRDVFEDELVPLIEEKVGAEDIYDLRIMIDSNTGLGRGFAFICFTKKEAMKKSVKELNDYEIRPGKQIKVNISTPNLRLFVGNLPKQKSREEILEEFQSKTEGLCDVIVYGIADDPRKKNRGFAFLEYDTHYSAANARKRLTRPGTRAWNNDIMVDWAEQQDEPDEETMAKVKILYVKNLTSDVDEEELKKVFGEHGKVDKVKKVKDYAFIHFEDRESAVKAMEELNNKQVGKNTVEISLAKPLTDRMKQRKDARRGGMQGGMYFGSPPMRGRGGNFGMSGGMRGGMGMGGRGFRPPPYSSRGGGYMGGGMGMGMGGFGGGYMGQGMRGVAMGPGGYMGVDQYGWGDGGGMGGGYYDEGYYGQPAPMSMGFRGNRGGGFAMGAPRGGFGMNRGMARPPRGNRGGQGPRGRGAGAPQGRGGLKRKQSNQGQDSKKPKVDGESGDWGTQPIAQQPLNTGNGTTETQGATGEQWYQDTFTEGAF